MHVPENLRAYVPTLRRYLPLVLVLVGVALLAFVAKEYWDMYSEQKRLAEQWEMQQRDRQARPVAAKQDDGLTRLNIPKISLDAIVVEGSGYKELKLGPGHMKNTPEPGAEGNSVITAHRDTFFRHIYELSKGDTILVRRNGEVLRYEVTTKKITKPEDMSVVKPTSDAQMTLITCYPTYYIGPAPERLVVHSKLVSRAPDNGLMTTEDAARAAAGGAP